MRKKILITKKALIRLYRKERKSKYTIGALYHCSFKTVLNRIREYGLKPLSRSVIQSRYDKKDFSKNPTERAYLIGFRLGDLNVYKTVRHSEVVVVRCHTTIPAQVRLINNLFKGYGQVTVSYNQKSNSYHINCFLNKSFEFLLSKSDNVERWIRESNKYLTAFVAGYIDAEGNIGVYDGRARVKIDSYDKNILFSIYRWFIKNGIDAPLPRKIAKKGIAYGYRLNKDLWRIRVSKAASLVKLFQRIGSHLHHKDKVKAFAKCMRNIYVRQTKFHT